jgi:hypothetical protein
MKLENIRGYVEYKFDIKSIILNEDIFVTTSENDWMWERYSFESLSDFLFHLSDSVKDDIKTKYHLANIDNILLSSIVFEGDDSLGNKVSELCISEYINKGNINVNISVNKDGKVVTTEMIEIKCVYSNGDTVVTKFNGTFEEAKEYYVGNEFNIGSVEDNVQTCIKLIKI